jgi:hypothetical protein
MKIGKRISFVVIFSLPLSFFALQSLENEIKPANPNVSYEARELLKLFHSISGQYTFKISIAESRNLKKKEDVIN